MTPEERIAQILVMQEVTAKNVEALSKDMKELVSTLPQFARVDEKYKSMDKRLQRLEGIVSAVAKIVGGVLITSIIGLVVTKGGM